MKPASSLPGQQQIPIFSPAVAIVLAYDVQALLTKLLGGLLPPELSLAARARVLDVACGAGNWALDLAFACPALSVVGVDWDTALIGHARASARVQRLANAHFTVADMFHMTTIPGDTFDLVHARLLAGAVEPEQWAALLNELRRVCRAGGVVCWSEWGQLLTNSPACNGGYQLFQRALSRAGGTTQATLLMHALLDELGWVNVQQSTRALDLSAGTDAYASVLAASRGLFPAAGLWLESMGLGDAEELAQLEQQVWIEVLAETFYATIPLVTVWGEK
jgi:SAM-dependent methyltransferase